MTESAPFTNTVLTTLRSWGCATVAFFKAPANVLSVLAIVAVVVVPGIEKILKRDEELNATLASLVDSTTRLVAMPDPSTDPRSATEPQKQMAFAQREMELNRATALANASDNHAYPSVLLALAPMLCREGRDADGQAFLQQILKRSGDSHADRRPNRDEVAQAHMGFAYCTVMNVVNGRPHSNTPESDVYQHVTHALECYKGDKGVVAQGANAHILAQWAEMDRQLNLPDKAAQLDRTANDLASQVRAKDPNFYWPLPPTTASAPATSALPSEPWTLPEEKLPIDSTGLTYRIQYSDQPDITGRFILLSAQTQDFGGPGILLRYNKGKFSGESSVADNTVPKRGHSAPSILRFQTELPITLDDRKPHLTMEWIIESATLDHFEGVQHTIGSPPVRFTAELIQPKSHAP